MSFVPQLLICQKKSTLDPALPENYQPIILLSLLANLVEKHVTNLVVDFLEKILLLDPSQNWLRPAYSSESAPLRVTATNC